MNIYVKTLSILFFACVSFSLTAQEYNSAIGMRLGSPLSISYKTFINDQDAIEVFGSFKSFSSYSWFALSGAYQKHNDVGFVDVENLKWYYGGGLSLYFWSFQSNFIIKNGSGTSIGVNGYLGLEYTFPNNPFSVSLDWTPTLFLNGFSRGFNGQFGSIAVRYILK